jgi:hypothetical protein
LAAICEPDIEGDRVWPFFRNDRLLGNPVDGMEDPKDIDAVTLGLRECCKLEEYTSVAMAAKYCMTFFVLSVFPAPDSPLEVMSKPQQMKQTGAHVMRMLWFSRSSPIFTHARSATAKI